MPNQTAPESLSPVPLTDDRARAWLDIALEEAATSHAVGGEPIGAALIGPDGTVLGRGHNRFVQDGDQLIHAETAAFRNAPYRTDYTGTTMVTTAAPCWYCSGLIRQFGISRVVIGATSGDGGSEWLAENGLEVRYLEDEQSAAYLRAHHEAAAS